MGLSPIAVRCHFTIELSTEHRKGKMCPARGHSTCHLAKIMEASCPPPVPSLQNQRSHPCQKTHCRVTCDLEQIPYLPPRKTKCPLSGASARPSELVNCPSSLSPRAWLPGMQAGPQAANASSSRNPSANLDPSWSRQRAGASCSASQHPLAANSTAAPILLGRRQAGASVTSSLPSPPREPT